MDVWPLPPGRAVSAGVAPVLGAVAGAALAAGTGWSVMGTLLIPRGRVDVVLRSVDRAVDATFHGLLRGVENYRRRDAVLAAQAPVVLVAQLLIWIAAFDVAYALLLLPVADTPQQAVREATSSMLTLGFVETHGAWATLVDAAAALTGLTVVALQISYLPTLYGAFNRRETEVTLLTARAGEPAWGPELLARTHYGIGGVDLAGFWASWERLAADLAESHASYPVLVRFRSPEPLSSWVVALLAVLDAAAMQAAVSPEAVPVQVRLTLRMGFLCLRRLAANVGVDVNPDPRPDEPLQLTFEAFQEGYQRLVRVGYPVERTAQEAWPHFRGWRVNYEHAAYALAWGLDAVPAPWSGPRRSGEAPIRVQRPPNRTPDDVDGTAAGRLTPPDAERG
jgi:hypothetical protein